MNNLSNWFFYRPLTFSSFIEIAVFVAIYLMVISLFTEKKTSLNNQLQILVLPVVIAFFYVLKITNILDIETIPFNTLILLFIGFVLVVLIELKAKK
jgi:hypothetical protein